MGPVAYAPSACPSKMVYTISQKRPPDSSADVQRRSMKLVMIWLNSARSGFRKPSGIPARANSLVTEVTRNPFLQW
jgi:hypothetical protein